jgi:hypothetical protein
VFKDWKDFLPYFSAILVGASYVSGMVAHRGIQALKPRTRLLKLMGKEGDPTGRRKREANLIEVWQFGSSRLHREVDFQYAMVVLLRSLSYSIPFLAISILTWLNTTNKKGSLWVIVIGIFIWGPTMFSYVRQLSNYDFLFVEARKIAQMVHAESTSVQS